MSAGTDAFLQSWDGLQAYAFPPVAIIPRVLAKLRASTGMELSLVAPHWAQRPWFSVGSGFIPGDSPAIYQSRWLLLRSSGAVFASAPSILARSISGEMVHLSCVVSQQWPFCLSSYLS